MKFLNGALGWLLFLVWGSGLFPVYSVLGALSVAIFTDDTYELDQSYLLRALLTVAITLFAFFTSFGKKLLSVENVFFHTGMILILGIFVTFVFWFYGIFIVFQVLLEILALSFGGSPYTSEPLNPLYGWWALLWVAFTLFALSPWHETWKKWFGFWWYD